MAVNPLDEVLSLLSAESFSEKPQNSLDDVLNIIEDLDSKLDVIKDDEPLDQVIDTLENLGDTFKILQGDEPTTESIAKVAFEELESSPKDFQKGLENLFNEIYSGRDTNEDLEYFSEEESDEGLLADTVSFFGDSFRNIAGLEEDTLTYLDMVILVISFLVFILVIFSLLVLVALCRRKIRGKSSMRLNITRERLQEDAESVASGDCSVSWISIGTDSTRTSASSLPGLENTETGARRPEVKRSLRGWTVAEISPSVLV